MKEKPSAGLSLPLLQSIKVVVKFYVTISRISYYQNIHLHKMYYVGTYPGIF
jgi:hypothetical protein